MKGFYEVYRRVNDVIERLIVLIAGLAVAVVVVLPFLGFAVRGLTGEGYTFLAETPPQLVPWIVLPMIGVLLRRDGHIAVDMLQHMLTGRALTALRVTVLLISLLSVCVMAFYGARTTAFFATLGQLSTTEIEFPLWYLYISFPIGFALAANFCLESLIGEALGVRPRGEAVAL
jgi:TRAP-type C4-dicarboxylate transport system permease small subunit